MANSLDDVIDQMRGVGLSPPDNLAKALDGYLRWRPADERKTKKSAWARLSKWTSNKTGREYITGMYGWRGERWNVEASTSDWSPEERAAELEARKAAEKAARVERENDARLAAEKAQRMWDKGRAADQGPLHPYLERKKVGAFALRTGFGNKLLIPLRDVAASIHGLQYISPEGEKIFGTGTAKEGKFHLIGEVADGMPIGFAEGYATGASAHMATGWPVVVCFDAGNLDPVVGEWRKLYPDHQFVLLGDDDRHLMQRLVERLEKVGIHASAAELQDLAKPHEWELPTGNVSLKAGWAKDGCGVPSIKGHIVVDGMPRMLKLENAGRSRATAAAKKFKGLVVLPHFKDADGPGTDFNDLHAAEGLQAVREQILAGINAEKTAATDAPQGGGKKGQGPVPADLGFLDRFTLIYGTTTVWDEQEQIILALQAMKAAYGKTVDWWLASSERRMVPQANVVFDPTGKIAQPETHVNLFRGLTLDVEKPGDATLIIKHLHNLCGEDDGLFHWVACWLALPLQRLGTKMRTSLIIHGRMEGTGKSFMMDIMRAIYGEYSRTITQSQLQDQFNGWQSGMLFCVAEEVVGASERRNLKNLIQNIITNPVVQINEKNLPLREEASYANFVFLSNEQIPMLLNDTDRRYTVIQVEQYRDQQYFNDLGKCIDEGGAEAFYRWLMAYDVGDFTPFTRPFETRARKHLITLGMSADQRFLLFWKEGLTPLPFVTATARDLYAAFQAWCRVNGERFVPSGAAFGNTAGNFLERLGADPPKKKVRFDAYLPGQISKEDWSMTHAQQGIVYFVPPALQRLQPGGEVVDDEKYASESPLDSSIYNNRIRSFQDKLAGLLAQARGSI